MSISTPLPSQIVEHYKLKNIVTKEGLIYMEIRKGMYALPQAGNLVHNKLKILLKSQGYYPISHTPNL